MQYNAYNCYKLIDYEAKIKIRHMSVGLKSVANICFAGYDANCNILNYN